MLGRLASVVAKQLLVGQPVVCVRCEEAVLSGGLVRQKAKYERRIADLQAEHDAKTEAETRLAEAETKARIHELEHALQAEGEALATALAELEQLRLNEKSSKLEVRTRTHVYARTHARTLMRSHEHVHSARQGETEGEQCVAVCGCVSVC